MEESKYATPDSGSHGQQNNEELHKHKLFYPFLIKFSVNSAFLVSISAPT